MTYVEIFDKMSIENISACLTFLPKRVIFLGDNGRLMSNYVKRYEKLLLSRGQKAEFICKTVNKNSLENIVAALSHIIEEYEDCIFDLAGGGEMYLVAMGIVYERYKTKKIHIRRFNVYNNTVTCCDGEKNSILKYTPELSVRENILIYGGNVKKQAFLQYNDGFREDIEKIWQVYKTNNNLWNSQIGVLEVAEKIALPAGPLETTVAIADLKRHLKDKNVLLDRNIFNGLKELGIIDWYIDGKRFHIAYKNKQVKKCLNRVGLALELKIFSVAKALEDSDGFVYNDVQNSVCIDWDGAALDHNTENEIDVMLMKGLIPVFISCKNGWVDIDELYKLDVVAKRFGGKYAKKVLVSTEINTKSSAGKHLASRAADMNIKLVHDVHDMNDEQLSETVKSFWK